MTNIRLSTEFPAWPGPYLQVLPQHTPSPVFAFTLGQKYHRISLSEKLQQLPFDKEMQRVSRRFRKHRNRFNPASWQYGRGFVYHRGPDETLVFDTRCRLVEVSKDSSPRVLGFVEIGDDDC